MDPFCKVGAAVFAKNIRLNVYRFIPFCPFNPTLSNIVLIMVDISFSDITVRASVKSIKDLLYTR